MKLVKLNETFEFKPRRTWTFESRIMILDFKHHSMFFVSNWLHSQVFCDGVRHGVTRWFYQIFGIPFLLKSPGVLQNSKNKVISRIWSVPTCFQDRLKARILNRLDEIGSGSRLCSSASVQACSRQRSTTHTDGNFTCHGTGVSSRIRLTMGSACFSVYSHRNKHHHVSLHGCRFTITAHFAKCSN